MTEEEMTKKIETLTRVVGNQSVMLHSLQLKVQSIYNLRDAEDSLSFQIHEIRNGLNEWANECTEFFAKSGFIEYRLHGDIFHDAYVVHEKCSSMKDVENVGQAIDFMTQHVCPANVNTD